MNCPKVVYALCMPLRREWSREFLEIEGAAEDFPYPAEPPEAEPAPDFDE